MELFESGWGLSLIVFLPLLGAVALLMVPKENESLVKQLALTVSVVTFGLSLLLIALFDYGAGSSFQFEANASWIDAIDARYHIGVDGISLWPSIARRSKTSMSFNVFPARRSQASRVCSQTSSMSPSSTKTSVFFFAGGRVFLTSFSI